MLWVLKNNFLYKTHFVGTQKNHLNETFLLNIQNICLKLWVRKCLQFYAENVCLSKPVPLPSVLYTTEK